jgi:hypothetical protein
MLLPLLLLLPFSALLCVHRVSAFSFALAVAIAFALAFLVVIPEGNLLLSLPF